MRYGRWDTLRHPFATRLLRRGGAEGIQNHAFDGFLEDEQTVATQVFHKLGYAANPGKPANLGFHIMPVQVREREVPTWTASNEKIRAFIQHLYPGMDGKRGQARRDAAREEAGRVALIIYRFFRALEPAETIAEELSCSVSAVETSARKMRLHAAKFFNGGCGCRRARQKYEEPAGTPPQDPAEVES